MRPAVRVHVFAIKPLSSPEPLVGSSPKLMTAGPSDRLVIDGLTVCPQAYSRFLDRSTPPRTSLAPLSELTVSMMRGSVYPRPHRKRNVDGRGKRSRTNDCSDSRERCRYPFGVLMIASPGAGALAVVWIIADYSIVFGLLLIALGFRLRRLANRTERRVGTSA